MTNEEIFESEFPRTEHLSKIDILDLMDLAREQGRLNGFVHGRNFERKLCGKEEIKND